MNNIDNGIMKPVGRTDPHSYDKVGVRSEPETLETFLAQRMLSIGVSEAKSQGWHIFFNRLFFFNIHCVSHL